MNWDYVGDGMRLLITNMFDIDGEETEDPKKAYSVVAMLPDGKWLATECYPHEIVKRRFQ